MSCQEDTYSYSGEYQLDIDDQGNPKLWQGKPAWVRRCEGTCSNEYIGMGNERWIHWTSEDGVWVISWHLTNSTYDDVHPWSIHGEKSATELPYDENNWSVDMTMIQGECIPVSTPTPTPTPEETPTPTPTPEETPTPTPTPEETPTPTPTPEETPTPTPTPEETPTPTPTPEETPTPTPTPTETPTPTPTPVYVDRVDEDDNVISTPMYDVNEEPDVPESMGPYFVPWRRSTMEYYNKIQENKPTTASTRYVSGYISGSFIGNVGADEHIQETPTDTDNKK